MNGKESVKELYKEREYLLGDKVNNKSETWHNDIVHYDNINHCLLIIDKDLDRLAELEKENELLKKDLKVLEIIKEYAFLFFEEGQLYCGRFGDIEVPLDEDDFDTKQEYDLIKGWLKNGQSI